MKLWCAAGYTAAAAACDRVLSEQLQIGAAIAVMFQLAMLRKKGLCEHCTAGILDRFSATDAGQAALMDAACVACTRVVTSSNTSTSLPGLENAFWMVETAADLVSQFLGEGVHQAVCCATAAEKTTGDSSIGGPAGPKTSSTLQKEVRNCQQDDETEACHKCSEVEHMLACARAAHDTMVKHTDQNVCISALKALKVSFFGSCWSRGGWVDGAICLHALLLRMLSAAWFKSVQYGLPSCKCAFLQPSVCGSSIQVRTVSM